MSAPVLAAAPRKDNADLVLDCRTLGYLADDHVTLDATFGLGAWWTKWQPNRLHTVDLHTPADVRSDFTRLPFPTRRFDAVCYDPPYKLNGRPGGNVDDRYGVGTRTRWQDRIGLMHAGLAECGRVSDRWLLVKCQDQVCSGAVRWQTFDMVAAATAVGFDLVDMLHLLGGRPQPEGRSQVHARRNYSTLLVFRRGSGTREQQGALP